MAPEAQAELRRVACRLYEEDPRQTHKKIAALLDVHPGTVQRWVAEHREHGEETLRPKPRPTEAKTRKLTGEQELWVVETVTTHEPRGVGLAETAFWTISLVRALIERQFGIGLGPSTVHRMMQRRGLRPRVPLQRAYTRDEAQVETFQHQEWPDLVSAASAGSTVVFLDEAGVREDAVAPTTWAPRGTRPTVRAKGSRDGVQVVSAVNLEGHLWFQTFRGRMNAVRFCGVLDALAEALPGPLVVVTDRHPAHRATLTREFVASLGGALRLVLLPSYAPDLNPAEHVWSYLKGHVLRRYPVGACENVHAVVDAEMEAIQSKPELVRAFFRHPAVRYTRGFNSAPPLHPA